MGYSGFFATKDVSGNPSVSAQDLDDRYQFKGSVGSSIEEYCVIHSVIAAGIIGGNNINLRGSGGDSLNVKCDSSGDTSNFAYTYSGIGRHLEIFLNGVLLLPGPTGGATTDYTEVNNPSQPYLINYIPDITVSIGDIIVCKGRVVNA